ncbi:MAG: ORF6N domain-containing protein [Planctomycetota bacterium]|nr:ORF6N domain-containing protein [Planctomycetota bacterium]
MKPKKTLELLEQIEGAIAFVRGQKVLLDLDLAPLYGLPAKRLAGLVREHRARIPEPFVFKLRPSELASLRHARGPEEMARLPLAFTDYGVALLEPFLRGKRQHAVTCEILRVFQRLRGMLPANVEICTRLTQLERNQTRQLNEIRNSIQNLAHEPRTAQRIGFRVRSEPAHGLEA